MLVQNRMTRDPVAVSPGDTLAHAARLTREHRIRHLPVVADGELVGIVSDRDIRLASPSPLVTADGEVAEFMESTRVDAVMTRDVVTVGPCEAVEEAAKLIYRRRVGALPVVDVNNCLIGILSETDVLRAFVEMVGGVEPSTRLEVSLPDRPGELARAVRVLGEDLRLNITGILVSQARRQASKTAIVHVATIDPREAIAALEAAGFVVGWPSLETDLRRGMGE
ncbi:MAG TPA: CBS and ACT domain-containing protein [Longimicrobiaceae bacterium]|jgi:acetoin utilization protein AcuB|nr:CBS and ACT domain-containing protein [Longimicrobiaceae bacterium]